MKYFIFRNHTIEQFFNSAETVFSGYDEIADWHKETDYYVWFYSVPVKQEAELLAAEIDSYFGKLQLTHSQLPSSKTFIIFTLVDLFPIQFQNSANIVRDAIEDFNRNIYELSGKHSNIKIIDFSSFANNYSREQLIDWKYYFISSMLLNPKLAAAFKQWFGQQINAIEQKRKKCIVLDLDNTLWGGILGEDGIDGIKIGGDYPGNAYLTFQKYLIELSKNGIIITICSKNNEQDVLEAWKKNDNIILKKECIAAYRINWRNKIDNIRELSEELNIGLDSMVFIDDNPSERELVRQLLPMVETPEFPDQPYNLPVFFKSVLLNYFQIYSLTNEDKNKLHQYKANDKRTKFSQEFNDFHDYLKNLEMEATIQKVSSTTTQRVAQLTQKTNQFNLTTKRYTEADIANYILRGDSVYSLSLKDKFGDHGVTGEIIICKDQKNHAATIDTLLLSCRILGKGVEKAFVNFILNKLKSEGVEKVNAFYIPTPKNGQTADFYEKTGFDFVSLANDGSGAKEYNLKIKDKVFEVEDIYKFVEI